MDTELLAPAGDLEAGYSALYFGADAVYLGLRRFSARAEATNFSPEDLDTFTAYAHSLGRKVYVAVNTLAQEEELQEAMNTLQTCADCHVDAVIVQDLGIARLVRRSFPELTLHASTQMAIHNLAGALALKKLGFKRVVLARELTWEEIQKIRQESGLEIEVFIHGALCYSYSGLCLFSSLETGRSANRGKCVYSCRDIFRIEGRETRAFSMRDLALEKEAGRLKGMSLKIEGRKKTALYVGAVTDYYRRILDTGKADISLSDNIKQIFARPWTKLHFYGKNKDVFTPDFAGHRGLLIGSVERTVNQSITFKLTHDIARYDGIQIDIPGGDKPFGFSVEQLTLNGKHVFEAKSHQTVTVNLPPHHPFIPKGASVYLASSTQVKSAYPYTKPKPGAYRNRYPLDVTVYLHADGLTAEAMGESITLATPLTPARQPTLVDSQVRTAFDKTGDTSFTLARLTVVNPEQLFAPASALNELRRRLYAILRIARKERFLPPTSLSASIRQTPLWSIKVHHPDMLSHVPFDQYDEAVIMLTTTYRPDAFQGLPIDKIRLALPPVMRGENLWKKTISTFLNAGFKRWEIGNLCGLSLLPKNTEISFDFTIPVMNTQSLMSALELGASRVTFSPEDTRFNICRLAHSGGAQTCLIVYQDTPLFLSANCIRPYDCSACDRKPLEQHISNGKGQFRLMSQQCQTVVSDMRPLALGPSAGDIPTEWMRADFCWRLYEASEIACLYSQVKQAKQMAHTFTGNFLKKFA